MHPGESNASYTVKGLIDALTAATIDAALIRDNFIVQVDLLPRTTPETMCYSPLGLPRKLDGAMQMEPCNQP